MIKKVKYYTWKYMILHNKYKDIMFAKTMCSHYTNMVFILNSFSWLKTKCFLLH